MAKIYAVKYIPENKIIYIGQTIQSGKKRWYDHVRKAKSQTRTDKFHIFLAEHNEKDFEFLIIEDNIETKEELNQKEKYYIELYDTYYNGYNSLLESKSLHSTPVRKKIDWYDNDKNLVGTYNSMVEAAEASGVKECNIGQCCNKQQTKTTQGWFYFHGEEPNFQESYRPGISFSVDKINPFTLEKEKTYPSVQSTEQDGFHQRSVKLVCEGQQYSTKGYFFKYTNNDFIMPEIGNSKVFPVAQINKDTNEIVEVFENKNLAGKKLNLTEWQTRSLLNTTINNCYFITSVEYHKRRLNNEL